jgi:hypothetical protein
MRSRGSTKVFALLRDMVRVVRRGRASGRTATDGDNDGTTAKDHLSAQYDQHQRLRKQSMARGCASRRFSNASSRLRMTKAEPFPGSSSGFIAIGWSSKQGEPLSSSVFGPSKSCSSIPAPPSLFCCDCCFVGYAFSRCVVMLHVTGCFTLFPSSIFQDWMWS